jgi:tRNA G10  N-methylase Trm11
MIRHPAKYTNVLLPVFETMIPANSVVLDPFAGTGKIHLLPFKTVGLEIEPEWAGLHPDTICGDATDMPFADNSFDTIVTSPTYGNRMADHHNAKDGTKRNTYTHILGRNLHPNNSGKMHFSDKYKELHVKAYKECRRVLRGGGLFILNIKNFIKAGKEVDVHAWHIQALKELGFVVVETVMVPVHGNGFGANATKRIPFEFVTKLRLLKDAQNILLGQERK